MKHVLVQNELNKLPEKVKLIPIQGLTKVFLTVGNILVKMDHKII